MSECISVNVPLGGPIPPRLWSRALPKCPQNNNPHDPLLYEKLNERRKAEIFQYRGNANPISKKQQYANFSRGRNYTGKQTWATQNDIYTNPNTSNLIQNGNTLLCSASSGSKCAMSYENDTPGPAIQICMNPKVPLYNYKLTRTYRAGGGKWPFIGGKPKTN